MASIEAAYIQKYHGEGVIARDASLSVQDAMNCMRGEGLEAAVNEHVLRDGTCPRY